MIVWWTGRGIRTPLYLIGIAFALGAFLSAVFGMDHLDQRLWFWGTCFLLTAVVNWVLGSRLNRNTSEMPKLGKLKGRLLYRARNRFMSLPMETWSIPLAIGGVVFIAMALTG